MTRRPARRSAVVDRLPDLWLPPAPDPVQAVVEGLDQVAAEMERKWGVGRLRLLVSDPLRAKFDQQAERLAAAIAALKD